jgi:hypothetical protein
VVQESCWYINLALFIWLIIRLIQLVFSAGTVFFLSQKINQQCFSAPFGWNYKPAEKKLKAFQK